MSSDSREQTMLIAYDGSENADRALEYAAKLLKPGTVQILTAWEPIARQQARAASRTGMHQATMTSDNLEDDPAYAEAVQVCRQGIAAAEKLGMYGKAHLVESATTIASAIVDAAQELDVDVIITGTRALTGFRALWSQSIAETIVKNAGVPVLVVPPENEDDDPEYFTRDD